MSNWYKTANRLAQALEIKWDDPLFPQIQRYEGELKAKGIWQDILSSKPKTKEEGKYLLWQWKAQWKTKLRNIIEGYESQKVDKKLKDIPYVNFEGKTSNGNEWWHMPHRTMHDPSTDLEELHKTVNMLFCGGNWCISQPGKTTKEYVHSNKGFMVLRRDGNPRIALVYQDNGLHEVRAIANNIKNLDTVDILDLMENPMFSFKEIKANMQEVENQDREEDEDFEDGPFEIDRHLQETFLTTPDSVLDKNPETKHKVEVLAQGLAMKLINSMERANAYYALLKVSNILGKINDGNHNYAYSLIGQDLIKAVQENFSKEKILEAFPRFMAVSGSRQTFNGLKDIVKHISVDDVKSYFDKRADAPGSLFSLLRNMKYYKSLWSDVEAPSGEIFSSNKDFILEKGYKALPISYTVPNKQAAYKAINKAIEEMQLNNLWSKVDRVVLFANDLEISKNPELKGIYQETIDLLTNSIGDWVLSSGPRDCNSVMKRMRNFMQYLTSGKLRQALEGSELMSYCRNNLEPKWKAVPTNDPVAVDTPNKEGNWYSNREQG